MSKRYRSGAAASTSNVVNSAIRYGPSIIRAGREIYGEINRSDRNQRAENARSLAPTTGVTSQDKYVSKKGDYKPGKLRKPKFISDYEKSLFFLTDIQNKVWERYHHVVPLAAKTWAGIPVNHLYWNGTDSKISGYQDLYWLCKDQAESSIQTDASIIKDKKQMLTVQKAYCKVFLRNLETTVSLKVRVYYYNVKRKLNRDLMDANLTAAIDGVVDLLHNTTIPEDVANVGHKLDDTDQIVDYGVSQVHTRESYEPWHSDFFRANISISRVDTYVLAAGEIAEFYYKGRSNFTVNITEEYTNTCCDWYSGGILISVIGLPTFDSEAGHENDLITESASEGKGLLITCNHHYKYKYWNKESSKPNVNLSAVFNETAPMKDGSEWVNT